MFGGYLDTQPHSSGIKAAPVLHVLLPTHFIYPINGNISFLSLVTGCPHLHSVLIIWNSENFYSTEILTWSNEEGLKRIVQCLRENSLSILLGMARTVRYDWNAPGRLNWSLENPEPDLMAQNGIDLKQQPRHAGLDLNSGKTMNSGTLPD